MPNEIISVNNVQIRELIYRGERVVTFEMVAEVHGTKPHTVEGSYYKNAQHFVEGKHTFLIDGEELQVLKDRLTTSESVVSPNARSLRVFTEQGYYMMVKPMRDEVSWRVQSEMAESYFKVQHALAVNPAQSRMQIIEEIIETHTLLANFFGVSRHIMIAEASKDMVKHGIPTEQYLIASPEMDNIADNDVWLEPTEIGKQLGISAKEANKLLEKMGLQSRIGDQWTATDAGSSICMRHSWISGTKSGYNLKWKLSAIKNLLDGE